MSINRKMNLKTLSPTPHRLPFSFELLPPPTEARDHTLLVVVGVVTPLQHFDSLTQVFDLSPEVMNLTLYLLCYFLFRHRTAFLVVRRGTRQ
jgi:hypothetical protein